MFAFAMQVPSTSYDLYNKECSETLISAVKQAPEGTEGRDENGGRNRVTMASGDLRVLAQTLQQQDKTGLQSGLH